MIELAQNAEEMTDIQNVFYCTGLILQTEKDQVIAPATTQI